MATEVINIVTNTGKNVWIKFSHYIDFNWKKVYDIASTVLATHITHVALYPWTSYSSWECVWWLWSPLYPWEDQLPRSPLQYCNLYIVPCISYPVYCTLYIVPCILCPVYCRLRIYTAFSVNRTQYTGVCVCACV